MVRKFAVLRLQRLHRPLARVARWAASISPHTRHPRTINRGVLAATTSEITWLVPTTSPATRPVALLRCPVNIDGHNIRY